MPTRTPIIIGAIDTALRKGEILQLTWKDGVFAMDNRQNRESSP